MEVDSDNEIPEAHEMNNVAYIENLHIDMKNCSGLRLHCTSKVITLWRKEILRWLQTMCELQAKDVLRLQHYNIRLMVSQMNVNVFLIKSFTILPDSIDIQAMDFKLTSHNYHIFPGRTETFNDFPNEPLDFSIRAAITINGSPYF